VGGETRRRRLRREFSRTETKGIINLCLPPPKSFLFFFVGTSQMYNTTSVFESNLSATCSLERADYFSFAVSNVLMQLAVIRYCESVRFGLHVFQKMPYGAA
jgi:hypothetical protein